VRRTSLLIVSSLAGLAAGTSAAPSALAAQEEDNAVFHYSLLEADAARTNDFALGRWHAGGWIGTDFDRLWWSSEGERLDGSVGEAEAMLLYGHYFRKFWDFVVGYRHDFRPSNQGYLTVGVMGLAPYWFEVGLFGFLSQDGEPSIRFEAETDLFLTQRWVLSLGGEADFLLTDDDTFDLAAGLGVVEMGVRTRYEVRRKFAPYLDLTWVHEAEPRMLAGTGPEAGSFRLGAGLRLIY